ncbi:MAG: hypothetical protein ACI4N6_00220 [Eubacteriales bacterium]
MYNASPAAQQSPWGFAAPADAYAAGACFSQGKARRGVGKRDAAKSKGN